MGSAHSSQNGSFTCPQNRKHLLLSTVAELITHALFASEFGLYFVLIVAMVGFFAINLIISVIISAFDRRKNFLDGSMFLTTSQTALKRIYRLQQKKFKLIDHKEPCNACHQVFYDIAESQIFKGFISFCIFANAVVMATLHYRQSPTWSRFQQISDVVFVSIFTLEVIIKNIGMFCKNAFAFGL